MADSQTPPTASDAAAGGLRSPWTKPPHVEVPTPPGPIDGVVSLTIPEEILADPNPLWRCCVVGPLLEAVACVGNIAKAMGSTVENHVRDLLDVMFSSGLSSTLVEALDQITISIPLLLPTVQDRLLDCISLVLSRYNYSQTEPPVTTEVRGSTVSMTPQSSEPSCSAQIQLALKTLARFNFMGHDLLEFSRESVVVYLDDADAATRKDAALCCCKLVANSLSGIAQFGSSRSTRAGGRRRRLVEEIVEKLLRTAVADADVTVRKSIFVALYGNQCFDDYLAQAESLTAIFASLNDEVLPELFHTVRTSDENLKDFITWGLGTLVSIVRQHIRKYLPELLLLVSELWSSFTLPGPVRPSRGLPVLHLLEHLCLALNDEFRTYLPVILPCFIQVLGDAERCNDYIYVPDILHTLEVFGGTLDEHMHLLLPALIRLFKVDAPVAIRRDAIKTLTRVIPCVQVTGHISSLVHHLKLVLDGKNDELRKDAVDALCCLAHALGEDFTIFIESVHKLLLKHRLRYDEAREYVERARKCLATELAALVLESYERAYGNMVRVQQLSELEEVIEYCTLPVGNTIAEERRALIRNMWTQRIQGSKRNVEVWQSLLAVRALVLPPTEDVETWIKFASLCRKSGRISQAKSTLLKLLPFDPEVSPENMQYHGPPQVMLGYLKYQWSLGEEHKRKEAFTKLHVGYILGLGDRHPSNLMLHRHSGKILHIDFGDLGLFLYQWFDFCSGKILHIDFGDCFEASMNREKFPEKVPFRLTRMLVKAMEVSGIEGNFRSTCENVMQVLRTNKDSVMAMMEAFVHDPLINWRLFNFNEVPQFGNNNPNGPTEPEEVGEDPADIDLPQPQRSTREKEILQAVNMLGDANEVLNERAVVVMERMSNKLTGRDFSTSASPSNPIADHNNLLGGDSHEVEHGLSVKVQVQKLIDQATSHENLCQNYVGYVLLHSSAYLFSLA
ncbi:hypothetical protein F2Q69_00046635 [Brassica cretica]|uniref:Non-specific serine/threonine protein kinase n=1 Tax=Brassica cretica TaxID=69181 RepID=A0A8S9Q5R0_BRACR|nr:hypothetical protein F2Q69_00046635 [Brassica cretica]